MKTYWLIQNCQSRRVPRTLTEDEFLEDNIEPDFPTPNMSPVSDKVTEKKDKSPYSPITFHDVRARFSISEMPSKNNLKKVKGIFFFNLIIIKNF